MNKRFAVVPAIGAGLVTVAGSASAALPEGVETALSAIGTDAASLATTILLAVVAVFAIKFLRKGL